MITTIKPGDDVHHKSNLVNAGLKFAVLEIEGDNAKCIIQSSDPELGFQEIWFPLTELTLAKEVEGGFKKEVS